MIDILIDNPVILLFIVAALGYWVGTIRIRGNRLGVAAVLFVGLGFGAINQDLHIPDVLIFLGLTMFVYTVGLSSGPSFFATFKRRGFTDFFFVVIMLTFSASITVGLVYLFDLEAAAASGLFSGVTTNTPALAGLLDIINNQPNTDQSIIDTMQQDAVVGYSISYPMGVIGVMISITLLTRWLKIDFKKEVTDLRKDYPYQQELQTKTILFTNEALAGISLRDLVKQKNWDVVFGRIKRRDKMFLPNWDTELQLGDTLIVVGDVFQFENLIPALGELQEEHLSNDRTEYDVRHFFVSNPKVSGERIATLALPEKFSAIVTRVIRGDMDILANSDTVLELGDRVRIVSRRKDTKAIGKLFGNSYEKLSHINLVSFGLGMALGLILGTISFEFPGGVSFKLGFAGGPLIVALILGNLRRTGPIVWTLPYSANLTLRQIGLMLLLAGIGINSGHTFIQTIQAGGGGWIFLASCIISLTSAMATLLIGYKILKIPFSVLCGMVASQPAILDFSVEKAGNKLPNIGFTVMLPIALITKIVYVQFLFALLR